MTSITPNITLRRAVADDAQAIGAVFDAAVRDGSGLSPDGTVRESDFDGMPTREVDLVKPL